MSLEKKTKTEKEKRITLTVKTYPDSATSLTYSQRMEVMEELANYVNRTVGMNHPFIRPRK